MAFGTMGSAGELGVRLVHPDGRVVDHPVLESLFEKIEEDARRGGKALISAADFFKTALIAVHFDGDGRVVDHSDTHDVLTGSRAAAHGVPEGAIHLGSGLITNVGVNFQTWNDTTTALATSALQAFNYHQIGTGATAAAATDYFLQTPQGATNLSGTTNGYMTGTASWVAPNKYQTQATFTATGAIAVSEWALAMQNFAAVIRTAVGTPTSTSFPDSGASFVAAHKGATIEIASTAINTPTTTVQGLITAVPTGTSLTIAGGWFTLANAGASTPAANSAYVIYPTALDHKQFSVVNMASGDTLQMTYGATSASGG